MKRLFVFAMILLLSFALSAQDAEKAKEKRIQDLEEKLEELSTEIEIIKATSDMGTEDEEQKFRIFGFMGSRFSDLNYDEAGNTPFSAVLPDKGGFMQTNLNLYFQFNPIENWKALAEIRFLYQPTGSRGDNEIDYSSADAYMTRTFIVDGNPVQNTAVIGLNNDNSPIYLEIPVTAEGTPAILVKNYPSDPAYDGTPYQGMFDSDGDGAPDMYGGYYPVDASGNMVETPVMTGTPVLNSIGSSAKAVSNWFIDQSNSFNYRYGSASIERAWMEWSPKDYFNVRIGKFFTPFGIWNVDHGLSVLMTARVPFLLKYLPQTQLGVQTYGTIYLPHTDLEYAAYVSNGRGNEADVYDINNDKSFGGRLNLKFQSNWFNELSIGGSGYFGKYTESVLNSRIDYGITQNDDGTINTNPSVHPSYKTWQEFDETLVGVDVKMMTKGLSFQAEYLFRTFDYTIWDDDYVAGNYSLFAPEKRPDVKALYAQIGYELPIDLKGTKFTPYYRFESYDGYVESLGINKTQGTPNMEFNVHCGGLNIRQNAFVTYKLDYTQTDFKDNDKFNFNVYTASAVISF